MCTPLELTAMVMTDMMLKEAHLDVAPLHRNGEQGGDTIFVLRAHFGGGIAVLGQVYMPYEQEEWLKTIEHLLPEHVRNANRTRENRIEDMFPDDPANPKNRNKSTQDAEPAPDDVYDVEWLKRLFEQDAQ